MGAGSRFQRTQTVTDEITELKHQLAEITTERDKLHAELVDARLKSLEDTRIDHENRIRPLEAGQIKANTIYALFAGNGLLSIVALVKIFNP